LLTLSYNASGFPRPFPRTLSGWHTIQFTWPELVRNAIKVGKPDWYHVVRHGIASLHEMLFRRHLIFANLTSTTSGELARSAVYEWLDPSEKGAISYFLALTATSLLAERLVNLPWLVHLAVFRHMLPRIVTSGSRRPGLVGYDSLRHAYVFECKGRTNGITKRLLSNAKRQARAVRTVGGSRPSARIVSAAYFAGGVFRASWLDPIKEGTVEFDLDLPPDKAVPDFYSPFLALLNAPEAQVTTRLVQGEEVKVARIPTTNDFVGLSSAMLASQGSFESAASYARESKPISDEKRALGMDGTYVELGPEWAPLLMFKQPEDRSA
jgi:hypothetical protein